MPLTAGGCWDDLCADQSTNSSCQLEPCLGLAWLHSAHHLLPAIGCGWHCHPPPLTDEETEVREVQRPFLHRTPSSGHQSSSDLGPTGSDSSSDHSLSSCVILGKLLYLSEPQLPKQLKGDIAQRLEMGKHPGDWRKYQTFPPLRVHYHPQKTHSGKTCHP